MGRGGGETVSISISKDYRELWMVCAERLKLLWCLRNVPAEVICICFGWEQRAQLSTFLMTSRPGIERAGAGIDLDSQHGFSL